jgi:hypothetical protein
MTEGKDFPECCWYLLVCETVLLDFWEEPRGFPLECAPRAARTIFSAHYFLSLSTITGGHNNYS